MKLICMLLVGILALLMSHQNAVVKGENCREGAVGKYKIIEFYGWLKNVTKSRRNLD